MKKYFSIVMPGGEEMFFKPERISAHEPVVTGVGEPADPAVHTVRALPCLFCGGDRTDIEVAGEHLGELCGPYFRRWRAH